MNMTAQSEKSSGRRAVSAAVVGIASVVIGAALLYFFPPEQYRLYPRCLLYSWTGWQCPGCGGLRATHQLLHGNFATAFQLNPLFVLLLPVLALLSGAYWLKRVTGRDWLHPLRRPFWLWVGLALAVGFTLARNLASGSL